MPVFICRANVYSSPQKLNMNHHLQKLWLIILLFLLAGCVQCPECGSLRQHHEITQLFNNKEIVEGYNYYYNGPLSRPDAILGLDEQYILQGQFWTPIDLTQEQLSVWIRDIQTTRSLDPEVFRGAEVLTPSGERAGVWLSHFDWLPTRFLENNNVEVWAPRVRHGPQKRIRW